MTKIWKYAALLSVLVVFSYYSTSIKQMFTLVDPDDEYEMIKKYLLNDSPLYGFNKPKIWIHTKYELNARKWRDFYSRNTYDLNEPYIHLTIKSVITHCSNDFHICLIDDETFSKLIPTWDIELSTIAEPMKSQYRQLGLAQLVYFYGGFVVPNSFLCKKNLKPLFDKGLEHGKPFVCETINRTTGSTRRFIPDSYFMGARKNDPNIKEYLDYLKNRSSNGHLTNVYEFIGDVANGCVENIKYGKMNLIGGESIGIKTKKRTPVLIEDLMEDNSPNLPENIYGIYIPNNELLKRPKYSWFCVLSTEQIIETNVFIARELKSSLDDSVSIYNKKSVLSSTVAI